ncbi:hypothetical protein HID58_070163, partial [Brassica napus]
KGRFESVSDYSVVVVRIPDDKDGEDEHNFAKVSVKMIGEIIGDTEDDKKCNNGGNTKAEGRAKADVDVKVDGGAKVDEGVRDGGGAGSSSTAGAGRNNEIDLEEQLRSPAAWAGTSKKIDLEDRIASPRTDGGKGIKDLNPPKSDSSKGKEEIEEGKNRRETTPPGNEENLIVNDAEISEDPYKNEDTGKASKEIVTNLLAELKSLSEEGNLSGERVSVSPGVATDCEEKGDSTDQEKWALVTGNGGKTSPAREVESCHSPNGFQLLRDLQEEGEISDDDSSQSDTAEETLDVALEKNPQGGDVVGLTGQTRRPANGGSKTSNQKQNTVVRGRGRGSKRHTVKARDLVDVHLVSTSAQIITLWVKYKESGDTFLCSFVYAFNKANERRELWREMEIIGRSVGQNPWIIQGDFNVALTSQEQSGSMNNGVDRNAIKDFQDVSPPLFHSRAALGKLQEKLKALKMEMRGLNRDLYGDLPERVKMAYEDLCAKQTEAMESPQTSTFEAASDAWEHWHHISGIEEQFYYQKSRVQWLGLGDRNSRFFHKVTQSRNIGNTIRRIVTNDGEILTTPSEIKREAVDHFKTFLNGSHQVEMRTTHEE